MEEKTDPNYNLSWSVSELQYLAECFDNLGNVTFGERLRGIAEDVELANKQWRDKYNDLLDKSVKAADQHSSNMLALALALNSEEVKDGKS